MPPGWTNRLLKPAGYVLINVRKGAPCYLHTVFDTPISKLETITVSVFVNASFTLRGVTHLSNCKHPRSFLFNHENSLLGIFTEKHL